MYNQQRLKVVFRMAMSLIFYILVYSNFLKGVMHKNIGVLSSRQTNLYDQYKMIMKENFKYHRYNL